MAGLSKVIGIALAGALAASVASPSSAAPISGGAGLKQAVPATATDVRWRGGGGLFAGLALGAIGGALLAGSYPYGYGYYPGYAYYGGPYWGPRPYWGYRHRYWRHRYWHRHWHRW